MSRLQRLFPPDRIVIADGGWGSELLRRGLVLGESADLWSLSRPEAVEAVARSYVEAGADVILTNTFQANPVALARFGKAGEAVAVNRLGAAISRRAAAEATGRVVRVFGSIGPGAGDAWAIQAGALAEGGVDALLFETLRDPGEARIAVAAARTTGLPIVVSFHFDDRTGEPLTLAGATPEEVARAVRDAGADAVGANCGAGPEAFSSLCRRLKAASGLPVWIKPNAGLPATDGGIAVYPIGPEAFAAFLPALIEAGASFVGGCCGAGPGHVRALAAARDQTP
jgi:methionine synthase I (cobalamin-dependent)